MKLTDNISAVLKYEDCKDCKLCKPYLKKDMEYQGDGNRDIALYELHCSHEEACGQFCRQDPDDSQD